MARLGIRRVASKNPNSKIPPERPFLRNQPFVFDTEEYLFEDKSIQLRRLLHECCTRVVAE